MFWASQFYMIMLINFFSYKTLQVLRFGSSLLKIGRSFLFRRYK